MYNHNWIPVCEYIEEMVLLFYVDYCLIFSPFKDKIDNVYNDLQADYNIEDDGDLKKYIGMEQDHHPYGSIHLM